MHGQLPVVWDRAEGFQVHDAWGNTWIDFTSTIFVTNAGHGNAEIIDSLQAVLRKPLLHSYTYATKERADYIEQLVKVTPAQFEKAFLLSAGTEATECALKLMRLQAAKTGKRRPGILCFEGNWHGRTMGPDAELESVPEEWIGFHDPTYSIFLSVSMARRPERPGRMSALSPRFVRRTGSIPPRIFAG